MLEGVEIRQIRDGRTTLLAPSDLAEALADARTDAAAGAGGLLWVDLPPQDPDARQTLAEVFCFHPRAVDDCAKRNPTPRLHVYADHAFLVLHVPDPGDAGHVHSIELDLFVGPNFLVTVHGPLNPTVKPEVSLVETRAVARRLDEGRWAPPSVDALVHAIVTGLNRRMDQQLAQLRFTTWDLERVVTSGAMGDPEDFLEKLFAVRLGLQAIRTMAALDHELYARMNRLKVLARDDPELAADSVDQFERIMTAADIQTQYLQGVIEFYQTRINTKMTVAAERLAVIAAVTLPITALSSVLGMNVIVNSGTRWPALGILVVTMAAMSTTLLVWAKRRGWW